MLRNVTRNAKSPTPGYHHRRKPLRGRPTLGEPKIKITKRTQPDLCFQQRKNGKANSTAPINRLPENFLPTTALEEQRALARQTFRRQPFVG
jgi:hypothetical protein